MAESDLLIVGRGINGAGIGRGIAGLAMTPAELESFAAWFQGIIRR